jgi:hypothetical protein
LPFAATIKSSSLASILTSRAYRAAIPTAGNGRILQAAVPRGLVAEVGTEAIFPVLRMGNKSGSILK